MTKEELDKLWELYREFCTRANQANMVMNVPEFFGWIEKFKVKERYTSFCTTHAGVLFNGQYYSHTIHTGTCDDCKN